MDWVSFLCGIGPGMFLMALTYEIREYRRARANRPTFEIMPVPPDARREE